jgi:hypothetical protein
MAETGQQQAEIVGIVAEARLAFFTPARVF